LEYWEYDCYPQQDNTTQEPERPIRTETPIGGWHDFDFIARLCIDEEGDCIDRCDERWEDGTERSRNGERLTKKDRDIRNRCAQQCPWIDPPEAQIDGTDDPTELNGSKDNCDSCTNGQRIDEKRT
jgi:hypothetical protein